MEAVVSAEWPLQDYFKSTKKKKELSAKMMSIWY